jgi:hypothetical protein
MAVKLCYDFFAKLYRNFDLGCLIPMELHDNQKNCLII